MYIAMNRFRVLNERTHDFEQMWINRESRLHEVPGFVEFHLLKGPDREDHRLYSSHTVWRSHDDFIAWTKSDAFRTAHARAGANNTQPMMAGPSEFEGFHVLQEVKADGSKKVMAAE